MPEKNKLSIYMIKNDFTNPEDIIEGYDRVIPLDGVGTVYIRNSHTSTPSWVNSFFFWPN